MKKLVLLFIIGTLLLASLLSSCENGDDYRYETFTLGEGSVHLSFEYPSFLMKPLLREPRISKQIFIGAVGYSESEKNQLGFLLLTIEAFPASGEFSSFLQLFNESIEGIERLSEYHLIERNQEEVDGVMGEKIIYSYYGMSITEEGELRKGKVYLICFEDEGLIWKIELIVDQYVILADEYFEHLLDKFKILE